MIPHFSEKENLENAANTNFISAIKELGISSLLGQCGIRKTAAGKKAKLPVKSEPHLKFFSSAC